MFVKMFVEAREHFNSRCVDYDVGENWFVDVVWKYDIIAKFDVKYEYETTEVQPQDSIKTLQYNSVLYGSIEAINN